MAADTSSIHITSSGLSKLDLSEPAGEALAKSVEVNNNKPSKLVAAQADGDNLVEAASVKISEDKTGGGAKDTAATETSPTNTETMPPVPHETATENGNSSAAEQTQNEAMASENENEVNADQIAIPKSVPTEEPELHELQTEWSLWLYTNNKARRWEENLQHVISFKTVEEFWAVYNHIQLSSRLSPGHDYAIFRAGMRPAWEDEANKAGGRWMISLPAKHHRNKDLDRLWLELMLLIIGEDFQNPEESQLVNGAVVSIRFKDDRIALWTADSSKGTEQIAIGKQIKNRLNINSSLTFESHASQSNSKSKHKPPMYTV